MSWVQDRVSGYKLEMKISRDARLKMPNESVQWQTGDNSFASDIRNACYNRYSRDNSCANMGLVGFDSCCCTYTEKAIRWACHRYSQTGGSL